MTNHTPRIEIFLGAYILLGALSAPRAQNAQDENPQRTIVIFSQSMCCSERSWLTLEETLRDEINATGLTVLVSDDTGADLIAQTSHHAWETGQRKVLGAIRVYRVGNRQRVVMEYALFDGNTEAPAEDYKGSVASPHDGDPSLAALRTTEALLAILIQQKLVPPDFRQSAQLAPKDGAEDQLGDTTKATASSQPAEAAEPSMNIGARVGIAFSTAAMGVKGLVAVSVGWLPLRRLSFELEASTTFAGQDLTTEETKSTFHLAALRLTANWRFVDRQRFVLSAGIGVGLALPWVKGLESDRLDRSSQVALAAYPGARLLVGWKFTDAFELVLDSNVGTIIPSISVEISGEEIAGYGRFVVESSIALRYYF